ncbi:alpha/beta hydrolase [Tundrisphaera sp. TA3]|uniref:alpha/beta hydrolase n=1 Tax=Tundrisphaera sp. TA3 TaxID=3435775 RepID=UPI003EBECB72
MPARHTVPILAALLSASLAFASQGANAAEPQVIPLWPGQAPGEAGPLSAEEGDAPDRPKDGKLVQRRQNVSVPTLTVYAPARDKANGTAVIIAPGGGYSILAWDLEGTEVAEWLNSLGVTAFVLKYRVPKRADDPGNSLPFMDAQRAVRLVRAMAGQWGLKPDRIGILGFSAGGNLAAKVATQYEAKSYPQVDVRDEGDARPDFAVLIYPAYLVEKAEPTRLVKDVPVTAKTPPMFLAHAANDPISPDGSIALFRALNAAKVPAELHVYVSGGHGYGLRPSEHAVTTWPARAADWLKARGLLTK